MFAVINDNLVIVDNLPVVVDRRSELIAGASSDQEGLWAQLSACHAAAWLRAERGEASLWRADGRLHWDRDDADTQEHASSRRQPQVVTGAAWSDHDPDERIPTTWTSVRHSAASLLSVLELNQSINRSVN